MVTRQLELNSGKRSSLSSRDKSGTPGQKRDKWASRETCDFSRDLRLKIGTVPGNPGRMVTLPKSTKYSAAAIGRRKGQRSAATNEAATLTRAAHNTLLIKTTHDSTPVCLDVVRMTRKRNTWRMDVCQITVYDALRVGQ